MKKDYTISIRTFENYKKHMEKKEGERLDMDDEVREIMEQFFRLYKRANRLLRRYFFIRMGIDDKRQRQARVLERKYPNEWRSPYKELLPEGSDNKINIEKTLTELLEQAQSQENKMMDATYNLPEKI